MRILVHHRIRSKDGQFVHLDELVNAWRQLGHEVRLVGPAVVATAAFGSDSGALSWMRAKLPRWLFELLEFGYSTVAAVRLARAVLAFRPDVIYERFNLFFPAGAFVSRLLRTPYFLEINGPLHEERQQFGGISLSALSRWSQRYTWTGAQACFPVTGVLAEYLVRYGVPRERILVLPNGVDQQRFFPVAADAGKQALGLQGKFVIGFVGFVRPWHRVDRLIELIGSGELSEDAVAVIVGDGPAIAELEALAARLGVAARVRFLGIVERAALPAVLGAFDLALQPAVNDWASPLKVIEYLAAGKVIIAPDQANIREILVHEENALLFDSDESFRRQVIRASEDQTIRSRLADQAARTVRRLRLTWRDNAARIVERVQPTSRSTR